MRVLLSEGSGLTSRQVATRLSAMGHQVGVVTSDRMCLARFTNCVHQLHDVPPYGAHPFGWLDAAVDVYRRHGYDLLFPTHEQVAVLSRSVDPLARAAVRTIVPTFPSLLAVQDKRSAYGTLSRLAIAQPATTLIDSREQLAAWARFPVFMKTPIGTATSGVRLIRTADQLHELVDEWGVPTTFRDGGVLAQTPVDGPLAMVQSVADRGRLVAFHAALRIREGARGGSSHKQSVALPQVREWFVALCADLDWHGALSADVILGPDGPMVIDVNPRLVEPMNAWRAGVDLVGAMLEVAGPTRGRAGDPAPAGRDGVRTHQLLLAVLGAAQDGRGRRGVARELGAAALSRGDYRDSAEELAPARHDLRTLAPVVAASLSTFARPSRWQSFSSGSVSTYAMGPDAWRQIRAGRDSTAEPARAG
ncbi:ATP-grasp domain-containing protein [soil metagenome]